MPPRPLPHSTQVLGHTWPSRNRGGGGRCQEAGHSWDATAGIPHIPPCRDCPPGCSWQQVCSYNAGVWGGVRRREDREPGPWHYPARMLGVGRGEGTETSGLWQPCPGPLKAGPGIAGLWGSQAGRSGDVGKHLAYRISQEPACGSCQDRGAGCSRPS